MIYRFMGRYLVGGYAVKVMYFFTRFCLVLPGFVRLYGVLTGFVGFWQVLSGFVRFCRVMSQVMS